MSKMNIKQNPRLHTKHLPRNRSAAATTMKKILPKDAGTSYDNEGKIYCRHPNSFNI